MKKLLVVGLFVLSVIGIGTALYFAFFRSASQPEDVLPESTDTSSGSLPEGATGGTRLSPSAEEGEILPTADLVARGGTTQVTELTSAPVENTAIGSSGRDVNYYDPEDGRFYAIDASGNAVRLSDQMFPSVESVSWNQGGDKAVLEFPDGANIVYDFDAEKQVTLPAHWEDFAFAPGSDQIIAKSIALDPSNRWLITSNADGSNAKPIQALGDNAHKVIVSWSPNDQIVAFADTGDPQPGGMDRKMIIPLGKNQENFKGLIVEGYGFQPVWSPDGRRLLYSASGSVSDLKPMLWLVDATPGSLGDNRRSLGVNTWADKCTFASASSVYCAVPASLPNNAGLGRSLFESTPDFLYKIDLVTGRAALVAIPEEARPMERLSVSADESVLYFTNFDSGNLEMIRLK
ncbi:MAG: hypothetical protein UY77_C0033G0008 [Candidatus Uhrbacteria bacterium GW2011_GWA2_53_10]|uniref:Uncharacterized protein n=1 Tax=Candidatus Uhrbacteria bacterium GW2011_GWA2_53_10 TaxID=1618980 RepID=A0A0G2AI08_9BACT|nr:MAG: hypothetical protein UY77_C0033G0008 [Candidatus Uhrbacteria bacterium GW2011_GWA2_53_10]